MHLPLPFYLLLRANLGKLVPESQTTAGLTAPEISWEVAATTFRTLETFANHQCPAPHSYRQPAYRHAFPGNAHKALKASLFTTCCCSHCNMSLKFIGLNATLLYDDDDDDDEGNNV